MKRIKNILFYSWWINFWVIILLVVMMWERPMLRFIGPMAFIAFIGYAFYAMLVTKPSTEPDPTPTEEKKETPPSPEI
jgi:hypothetical protein